MLRSSRYGQRAIVISCLALLVILLCFAAAARAAEPVKVGMSMARIGPLAGTDKAALLGTQIWVEDINVKGGILGRPIQLIYYDDQSNPLSNPSLSCLEAPGALSNLVPAEIAEIPGNPPVFITESRQACDQLMTQLVLEWTPRKHQRAWSHWTGVRASSCRTGAGLDPGTGRSEPCLGRQTSRPTLHNLSQQFRSF